MGGFVEIIEKLSKDTTKVELGDVIQAIIGSIVVLQEKHDLLKSCIGNDPDTSYAILNAITNTLIYNMLYIAGYSEEEIKEISKKIDDEVMTDPKSNFEA